MGRALFAHPYYRVRCDHCRKLSRVKMSATAVKREVANYFVLAALIIVVFFWLLFLDPLMESTKFWNAAFPVLAEQILRSSGKTDGGALWPR